MCGIFVFCHGHFCLMHNQWPQRQRLVSRGKRYFAKGASWMDFNVWSLAKIKIKITLSDSYGGNDHPYIFFAFGSDWLVFFFIQGAALHGRCVWRPVEVGTCSFFVVVVWIHLLAQVCIVRSVWLACTGQLGESFVFGFRPCFFLFGAFWTWICASFCRASKRKITNRMQFHKINVAMPTTFYSSWSYPFKAV